MRGGARGETVDGQRVKRENLDAREMREIVWALIRRRARVRAPPRRSARKRAVRSDRSEHTPPATSAAGAGNGPSSRDASAVNIEAAARRERRGTKTKTRQMAAANGESARGELTRVESSKVVSESRLPVEA